MNGRTGKSLKEQRIERDHPVERVPYATYWMRKILAWSRLQRMILVTVFALALTAAVFPVVDGIYLQYFFAEESRILPSLVSLGIGIMMYGYGWWLVVGFPGEPRPERRAIIIYLIFGMALIIFILILIVNGYYVATLPDV